MLFGFVSFLRGVITHLRLIVLPTGFVFDRSQELFMTFFNIELLLTLLFFVTLFVVIFKFRNRMSGEMLFLISWICFEYAPVSQVLVSVGVQPGRILVAEHFMYMPAVGIFALAVMLFDKIYQKNIRVKMISPKIFFVVIAALYSFFFLMTVQQCVYSSNEIAMLERSLELSPDNIRIRNSLAYAYAKLNKFEETEKHFRKSVAVVPDDSWALIGLGKSLCDQGRFWEGIEVYERIEHAGALNPTLKENLSATYNLLKTQYESMLNAGKDNYQVRYSLGLVYSKLGKSDEAIEQYKISIKMNPDFKSSIFNLASVFEAEGDKRQAVEYYRRTLESKEKDREMDLFVLEKLVRIYNEFGEKDKAEEYNKKLIEMGG